MVRRLALLILTLLPSPALAQASLGQREVIVTAARREADGFDASTPAVTLTRRADFAVQEVTVTGDTRDPAARHAEMFATVKNAIDAAGRRGLQLATGDAVVEPLTLANYRNLSFEKDDRPDSEKLSFLVKAPLGDGVDAKAVIDRIDGFVKSVAPVGRALLTTSDDLTLSVVRPDQYRPAIAALVAEDARAMAARFGTDYAVEARGLERPVEWSRAGLTDVLLYLPYQLTVVPKR